MIPEAEAGRPYWRVGPPGSGKTEATIRDARAACAAGERVLWIAPARQRAHLLRRIARHGPLAGLEVVTVQQLAYTAMADRRRPLLIGTGRLATVAEALRNDRQEPPTPGEARLFARAVAEAKRYGVRVARLAGDDAETARLRRIQRAYERAKEGAWDYDDYLHEATLRLETEARGAAPLPADRIVIDGAPEADPAELRLFRAAARHLPVLASVETPPPGVTPDEVVNAGGAVRVDAHRFPNPVGEARWVLRDLKAVLAGGAEPLDLALIVPPGRARAVIALADEYGLPLMDETPRALNDRPEGRRLTDLLELPDAPTAARLLSVPELHGLGAAALRAGVAGHDGVRRLARERGELSAWEAWLQDATPDGGDDASLLAWGERTVRRAVAAAAGAGATTGATTGAERGRRARERFEDEALRRLGEAARVAATGPEIRAWWAALLQEPAGEGAPPAGVAVLHPDQAVGRRYRRAWLVGASEGAFAPREREDYFVPEDARADPERAYAGGALPKRFSGRRPDRLAHLRARADRVIVTVPDADRGGRVAPESALVGPEPSDAPARPAGAPSETRDARPYAPPDGPVELGPPEVGRLLRHAECGFRAWAEPLLRERTASDASDAEVDATDPGAPLHEVWSVVRRALRARERWSEDALADLAERHPAAGPWLRTHAAELATLRYGVRLEAAADPDPEGRPPYATVDAAGRDAGHARLVRFVAPGAVTEPADVARRLARDGRDLWAARTALARYAGRVQRVTVVHWPVGGDPVAYPSDGFARVTSEMDRVDARARAALPAWRAGVARPEPGYVCRDCPVYDVCREGRR